MHVVFGQIIKGVEILDEIEKIQTENDKPVTDVLIEDCGELKKWFK